MKYPTNRDEIDAFVDEILKTTYFREHFKSFVKQVYDNGYDDAMKEFDVTRKAIVDMEKRLSKTHEGAR